MLSGKAEQFNLTREEYLTIHNLQSNKNAIIKPADKKSVVVVWDRNDYFKVAGKQLSDRSTYLETKVIEKDFVNLVEQSSKLFENLQRKSVIQEREKNFFNFNFKRAAYLGKLYLLPKIHKSLSKVQGALSFRTVEHRLKIFQNSLTTNCNPL